MNAGNKAAVSQAERRTSLRRQPRAGIEIECRKGTMGLGPNLVREFFDISETGVRLVVKSPLKKGDEVEVLIKPGSGAQPIKRLADIIFAAARPDGAYAVGLRFSKMLTFAEVQSLAKPGKNLG